MKAHFKIEKDWKGDRITEAMWEAGKSAVHDGAEKISTEAKKIVPHETGVLEDSITVVPGKSDAHQHTEHVVANTPYAVVQHETPSFQHEEGRKWKYIEDPAEQLSPQILELIRLRMWNAQNGF